MRKAIFEGDFYDDPVGVATDIDNQILKPQKRTILHDYIEYLAEEEYSLFFREAGWDYDCMLPALDILKDHQVQYLTLKEFSKESGSEDEELEEYQDDYSEYIEAILQEKVIPIIVNEVFTLLFSDREAMKAFNLLVSKCLSEKTPRCTYWPKWLIRALFCREKGLCALCKTDLSSIYHTQGKMAIDHIVPLALFGTNDPTNFQILCEDCNSKKGGTEIVTSNSLPLYW